MLTSDLVRASVRGGKVKPRYVDPSDAKLLEDARRLVGIFEAHVGRTVGELDEAIADHIGDSTEFQIQRGLAKLLMDKASQEVRAPGDPEAVRAKVYALAAERWPVGADDSGGGELTPRSEVLQAAGEALGLSAAEVEASLYADLKSAERLVDVWLPDAEALLHRYNLALAQAVLLRAREVVVELPGLEAKRARQLFRIIKFHRLMHRAERGRDGYRVVLDGPLSLFRQTNRYGLQLALFLPGLCHCDRWSLTAEVAWGDDRRPMTLEVSHETGLVTHTKDTGTWESDEERHFRATWKATDTDWTLRRGARVADLGGEGVLVPDYVLKHADGRTALLDIVWFWRKKTFQRRLELLQREGPPNLIVAVATRLNADEKSPRLPRGAIYPFKGVIQPKKVIALAEEVAT